MRCCLACISRRFDVCLISLGNRFNIGFYSLLTELPLTLSFLLSFSVCLSVCLSVSPAGIPYPPTRLCLDVGSSIPGPCPSSATCFCFARWDRHVHNTLWSNPDRQRNGLVEARDEPNLLDGAPNSSQIKITWLVSKQNTYQRRCCTHTRPGKRRDNRQQGTATGEHVLSSSAVFLTFFLWNLLRCKRYQWSGNTQLSSLSPSVKSPKALNDSRPVALQYLVMKVFEQVLMMQGHSAGSAGFFRSSAVCLYSWQRCGGCPPAAAELPVSSS